MRRALDDAVLVPQLLEAVCERASAPRSCMASLQRLSTFGLFLLAQKRHPGLYAPLMKLLDAAAPELNDEWLCSRRLRFHAAQIVAAACPDGRRLMNLAEDPKAQAHIRGAALEAIGLLAAFGDATRAETVSRLRALYPMVRRADDPILDSSWVSIAAKVHWHRLDNELRWFMSSGRLPAGLREVIADATRQHPDTNFVAVMALEPPINILVNVFAQEFRDGEVGLVVNKSGPDLSGYLNDSHDTERN